MIKTVLTIAGSDSCCGAGIQIDLKIISFFNAYGICAITALTAQNTQGVQHVFKIPADFVGKQIDSVSKDIEIDAVKTGMLVDSEIVNIVANKIRHLVVNKLVVDPVIVSKNGSRLLADDAVKSVISGLIPIALLVTPNIPEAEILAGNRISNIGDVKTAAKTIKNLGAKNVLIKGGHLGSCQGTGSGKKAVDVLFDGRSFEYFESEFIDTKGVHGTGCAFSAAITAELAKGNSLINAVRIAKEFISKAIGKSMNLGEGYALINL